MSRFRFLFLIVLITVTALFAAGASAETEQEGTEQGLNEIQSLFEMADVKETEGMSLEEMTDAFADAAMCEYADSVTGFSMQYPAIFRFDDSQDGLTAFSEDGKASLSIENLAHGGNLTLEMLTEAIKLEVPDYDDTGDGEKNILRVVRKADQNGIIQTDLYFLAEKSLHHIILRYPSSEEETYSSYIDYMVNTMETSDSEQG